LVPVNVLSEGFLDHENMFEPGIFQPDEQPTCEQVATASNKPTRIHDGNRLSIAINLGKWAPGGD